MSLAVTATLITSVASSKGVKLSLGDTTPFVTQVTFSKAV